MKTMVKACMAILLLYLPASLFAQAQEGPRLSCPLNDAVVVPPPKDVIQYDRADQCIVLTSKPDTIVKACIAGRVTNVERDEEGKFGVVIFAKYGNKDYYFWYTGLSTLVVKRMDKVNTGQSLGFIKPDDKIELMMYDFETPVDPAKYLDCAGILKAQ